MTFTDEDLKRLKERCESDDLIGIFDYELPALLARLEAAEKIVIFDCLHDPKAKCGCTKELNQLIQAWRKAAGK